MMNCNVMFLLLFSIIISCAQNADLDCNKFRNGTFYAPPSNEVKDYFTIIRNENIQMEIDSLNSSIFFNVKWNNECNYTLTLADPEKDRFDERFQMNRPDSINVEFVRSIQDTVYCDAIVYHEDMILKITGSKVIRTGDVPPR